MKLSILISLGVVSVVAALPPIVTIGYQGSARSPITIMRLAMSFVSWATPCTEDRRPNGLTYRDAEECVRRCPGHCSNLANCNATCVMENRCVCAASQYCLLNWEQKHPNGTFKMDCYDFDKLPN